MKTTICIVASTTETTLAEVREHADRFAKQTLGTSCGSFFTINGDRFPVAFLDRLEQTLNQYQVVVWGPYGVCPLVAPEQLGQSVGPFWGALSDAERCHLGECMQMLLSQRRLNTGFIACPITTCQYDREVVSLPLWSATCTVLHRVHAERNGSEFGRGMTTWGQYVVTDEFANLSYRKQRELLMHRACHLVQHNSLNLCPAVTAMDQYERASGINCTELQ